MPQYLFITILAKLQSPLFLIAADQFLFTPGWLLTDFCPKAAFWNQWCSTHMLLGFAHDWSLLLNSVLLRSLPRCTKTFDIIWEPPANFKFRSGLLIKCRFSFSNWWKAYTPIFIVVSYNNSVKIKYMLIISRMLNIWLI